MRTLPSAPTLTYGQLVYGLFSTTLGRTIFIPPPPTHHSSPLLEHIADSRQYSLPTEFTKRPGFNQTGKQITMNVNSYLVTQLPQITIYQYDVIIGSGAEKRVVQRKAWNSKARVNATSNDVIYDGNKLAWSLRDMGQVKVMVDLDVEEGLAPSRNGKNAFRVHITPTKKLDLSALKAYMDGKIQYNTNVMEAINFMDHLLREGPSRNARLVPIKRSFFARNGDRMDLGLAVEVFRGVYQTMRPAQGNKMIINLDVAISSFWKPQALISAIVEKNRYRDAAQIGQRFQQPGEALATRKYLKRLQVKAVYKGNPKPQTVWIIESIAKLTAQTHRIQWRDNTGQDTGEMITVAAYFQRKYNLALKYPTLPLIEMTKKFKGQPAYFPMELLVIVENQRYGAKLDETQTSNMIKFAVSPPSVRNKAIEEGKSWLQWEQDAFLRNYGLKINPTQLTTQARILPSPGIQFGQKTKVEQPGTKGRWDLRGKTFFSCNPHELSSWGIGIFPGRMNLDKAQLEKFAFDFIKQYRGHGGTVSNAKPHMMQLPQDPAEGVAALYQAVGNAFQKKPQMLVFVVQNKDSQHYLRIKKSSDCRFGVVSQVMQAAQVAKCNPQYISNVLMKFNAKLGGSTSTSVPHATSGFKKFSAPTVFIGADVSHASPGSEQPSMAALTVSYDRNAARYAAGCQTNGRRVEMITEKNMRSILGPLLQTWMSDVGGGKAPAQVYYMRDGVSEGQFIQVMQEEIPHVRGVLDKLSGGSWSGKLTVVIASKRHHIRAFPRGPDADSKGNPLPGTLIERDVTTPLEFDFYLYSHIALQGTSRPVHYTVLHDEANHPPHVLQNMIYEHCYQYMRSTTSVSLHPAVYYAHLASNRAKAHENVPATAGPQGGAGYKQNLPASSDTPRSSEVPDLIPLEGAGRIRYSMWYI